MRYPDLKYCMKFTHLPGLVHVSAGQFTNPVLYCYNKLTVRLYKIILQPLLHQLVER